MKPTKNRVFCRDCGRNKMLFKTEKKANNFIIFNQEEIEKQSGIAPQRSYFCLFCGGWHITSIKEEIGVSKSEELFEKYLKEKAEKKDRTSEKTKKRNEIMSELEKQIKTIDANQLEMFFSEKIDLIKNEIKGLSVSKNTIVKEKLRELRQNLEILYIVRKKNGFQKKNNNSERLKEKEIEEWRLWLEKKGYKKE